MDAILNALSCLMALGASMFLWRKPLNVYKEAGILSLFLAVFCLFSYFTMDASDFAQEYMPFRMLGICLCFSTVQSLTGIPASIRGEALVRHSHGRISVI